MLRSTALAITLAFASAGAGNAAIVPPRMTAPGSLTITVGEGCGAGWWRAGPGNVCRPFNGPYGSARGTRYECPPGWHIGPERGACWPNR